ncbi:MAG: Crp/Fnr family transcriptional regulator [Rubrobacteraceae bacterium]
MVKLKKTSEEAMDHSLKLLSMVDIFEPLSREEIEEIEWKKLETRMQPGEVFFTPMDLSETLFILQEGRVRIFRKTSENREFTLAVFGSGTVFGEMALTAQRLRNSYAQALEPSTVSAMCNADLERLILRKPQVGLQLAHLLSERLISYEIRMEALGLREVPARLASLILQLIESEGVKTEEYYKIPTHYTHQQLGTMVGANREAITRAFARLQDSGTVELKRRKIHVRDLDALKEVAQITYDAG